MTFTVIARCEETQALGICLATSPYAVASRCPHIRENVAAISTQCHTNARLGPIGLELAKMGLGGDEILTMLRSHDRRFEYRQIGIVGVTGAPAAYSGIHGKPWTGHRIGESFVLMGNGLVGPEVVDSMHKSYRDNADERFEERLMRTVEAGAAAGGEAKGHRSAGLLVAYPGQSLRTDLRVDMANPLPEEGGDAVRDLRRILDASYQPLIPYYRDYWPDHPEVGWRDWAARAS